MSTGQIRKFLNLCGFESLCVGSAPRGSRRPICWPCGCETCQVCSFGKAPPSSTANPSRWADNVVHLIFFVSNLSVEDFSWHSFILLFHFQNLFSNSRLDGSPGWERPPLPAPWGGFDSGIDSTCFENRRDKVYKNVSSTRLWRC